MNRAVHDDIVAIEMLPESQWTCPSSMVLEDVDEKPDEDTTNEVHPHHSPPLLVVRYSD